jgi:hypothetical protein
MTATTSARLLHWQHLYGDGTGYLCLLAGTRQAGRLAGTRQMFYPYPVSAEPAALWLDQQVQAGRETYMCAHLLTRRERVKDAAAPVWTLWADLDGATVPDDLPQPTAVIRTSPGREHGYWRLTTPIAPQRAEDLNQRLAAAIGADASGYDLTQLLRPADTINHKYPAAPAVELVHCDDNTAYDPDVLARRLSALPASSGDDVLGRAPAGPIGERIPDGQRNTTLASLAGTMRRRGMSTVAIEAALLIENTARCDPPLDAEEVAVIAASMARYHPAPDGQPAGGNGTHPPAARRACAASVVTLDTVAPEHVTWLWPGRIPFGKLTIIDGDPGLGKSLLTLDIAARVTTGRPMPDGTLPDLDGPAAVVLISAEDGYGDTIRPRLDLAGADPARVVAITGIPDGADGATGDRPVTLPDDLPQIEQVIIDYGARLVIYDPLMAFFGSDTNSYRDQDVRRALAPLAAMLERTGAAGVIVRHLNKSASAHALYRGGGSIGIIGAARSGLLVAPDPEDESQQRRIVAVTKSNLAALAPALAYRVEPGANEHPYVVWEGVTHHRTADLLTVQSEEERSALEEAKEYLRHALADGPRPSAALLTESRKYGVAEKTLRRAVRELGIKPRREGFGADGGWVWELPKMATDAHRWSSENVAIYGDGWPSMDDPAPAVCPSCGAQQIEHNGSRYYCGACFEALDEWPIR